MDTATIPQRFREAEPPLDTGDFDGWDWLAALDEGFPHETVDAAVEAGLLSREESEILVIPRRTLSHRRQKDQRLSRDESDRLLRIARVRAQADAVFRNPDKAARWLRKPSRVLRGAVPLKLLQTSTGEQMIREELIRIQHGIFT